jgi:hypothetical protein
MQKLTVYLLPRMPVGDWNIEANKAQRTRQPLTRRGSSSLAAAEPLVALARLLARQTAGKMFRNAASAVASRMMDPAR